MAKSPGAEVVFLPQSLSMQSVPNQFVFIPTKNKHMFFSVPKSGKPQLEILVTLRSNFVHTYFDDILM